MFEPVEPDLVSVVILLLVSFGAYVIGVTFRKWPEKVQRFAEDIDGSVWMISPAAHRALIQVSSHVLIAASIVALCAAGSLLR